MRTLEIRISIDIPDGVAVSVGNGATASPPVAPPAPRNDAEPPWPGEAPVDAAVRIFDGMGDLVSAPESVLHDTPHVVAAPTAPPGGHHGAPWVYQPAGVSKRTGKPYTGFWHCVDKDCNEKPAR